MTRILLVEDDFAIVHSLQEYLNLEGFTSDHASGQKEAEELLKTKQYQLLLLDVSLKDGNGFAVCNIAQKIQLPVIFLSASSDEETVVRGLNIGADHQTVPSKRTPLSYQECLKTSCRASDNHPFG